ncbi:hypothetical protein [Actinomadura sp. WMMA1423]|uniref:hypothetical protein n=1 Tax=Actinomadura sp. WMMA1423 TaxID=2591108 RepID=UPI00114771E8|nr:hypothetical protein [Actinomadura sp. WMMA1423]
MLVWWQAVLWGMAGGGCVEALELYAQIHRSRRRWSWRRPIPQGLTAFAVSVLIRLAVGAAVAAALAASGQVSGPLAAFGLGVAAPLVIEKLARLVPLQIDARSAFDPQAQGPPNSAVPDANGASDQQPHPTPGGGYAQ